MRKLAGLLAAAVVGYATPAAATNGMRMIGFGPVQDSMGGASVGAPLDAATIVTNPAGMSSLERRVDLAGTWFNPTVKYKATDGYGMTSGNEQESDRAASLIPTFGVIVPVGDKLSLGLGVVRRLRHGRRLPRRPVRQQDADLLHEACASPRGVLQVND